MADAEKAKLARKVHDTLHAATQFVAEQQEWADRIRANWSASERTEKRISSSKEQHPIADP